MSDLPPLEHSEDSRGMAGARILYLHPKRENNQLQPDSHMPEVSASQSRDTDQKTPVVDSIERQLAQMQKMAAQLFPEDEIAANRHHVVLLEQRIRELGYRVLPLQVKEMR